MRVHLLLLAIPFLLAADMTSAALPVGSDCLAYANTHTLVRDDVLAQLQSDRKNLATCEPILTTAQANLTSAKSQLLQAEKDLQALHKAALEQRAVIAELSAQRQVLENHITKLENLTCPEPTVSDQLVGGWESVDGVVGIGVGYALGTTMCIGTAWVFNQPAFVR